MSDPVTPWQELPYAPRASVAECEQLIDIYHERFGNLYEFDIVPAGAHPTFGLCVPYSY